MAHHVQTTQGQWLLNTSPVTQTQTQLEKVQEKFFAIQSDKPMDALMSLSQPGSRTSPQTLVFPVDGGQLLFQ